MKKVVKIIIVIAVLGGLVGLTYLLSGNMEQVFSSSTVYSVKTVEIGKGSISSSVSASGKIEEVDSYDVYIDNPVKVKKLLVEKYQKVSKGQQLVEFDIEDMETELEKLKINKKVQELSQNSPTVDAEIKRAESAVKSAEQALSDAEKKYEDSKKLFEAQAISKSELDMAENAVRDARTALENATVAYNAAVESKDVDQKVKKENLNALILSISDLEKKIQKTKESMFCPFDGIVTEINIQEGAYTSNMQPAFRIVNLDKLKVKAMVNEYNIKDVKVGQKVRITGDAIREDVEVFGVVESISPVAKTNMTASGEEVVIEVDISIDNTALNLKPGLSVDCEILTDEKKDVVVVPMGVLKTDKDGNEYVLLVDKEKGVLMQRNVKLGIISDMTAEVLEGLAEGDIVVDDPQSFHKDGSKVRIIE
ncbi:MAG TPA: efflux RND transporter periplasmic adaptor subunit [Hungateiclostridium thermocellum]|jgi:HlyD family secretion protein|uniref:Efflux transporter, RND family, MFP subunit n=2 Tax=Acetivibrio thermocellus TaxID=1515 RepID=A3DGA4_ACET2|nr:efflux RND transporter periplasmic adaptor subunit [Acetivibrio thermocellus]CDG36286.1 RND family efflux transporter MFP subunit [Acetivibrio thermocellus BC1]ABN52983.1 efflux transporter, RND family, MFP subunit [Acetivibrio thermocellus ATCC 27405]ADU75449.1 efflux transporter, RND family, MFP subunit [Acetivibrio thermocellus DSM 1313]ALX09449.1 efflux transporter, RND family, MFP subunit [Acetivibrio thermocellus AD2]ANV77203.1 efflux transporter, RND family, MFP subunit [Acetivibrio 